MVYGEVSVVAASVKNSAGVSSPWAGVSSDGQRSLVSNEVHDGLKAVWLQDVVPGDGTGGLSPEMYLNKF